MKQTVLEAVRRYKIISILRGVSTDKIVDTARALYAGGIRMLEITFDQSSPTALEDTAESIRLVLEDMGDKMMVGAGTVMTLSQLEAAHKAGARYILAPNTNPALIQGANNRGMTAIPGALTPTEISDAYAAGAEMVKLFPAGDLKVSYLKSIMAPINHIPLLVVGGIDEKNIRDYLRAGATGAGIGSNIAKNSLINEGRFQELTELAQLYTETLIGL